VKHNSTLKIILIILLGIWSVPATITGVIESVLSKGFSDYILNIILTTFLGILPAFLAYRILRTIIHTSIQRDLQQPKQPVKQNELKPEFHIIYCDNKGKVTGRNICNIKLKDFEENAYIDCYCFLRNAERTFKLNNIKTMVDLSTGELIENPKEFVCNNF